MDNHSVSQLQWFFFIPSYQGKQYQLTALKHTYHVHNHINRAAAAMDSCFPLVGAHQHGIAVGSVNGPERNGAVNWYYGGKVSKTQLIITWACDINRKSHLRSETWHLECQYSDSRSRLTYLCSFYFGKCLSWLFKNCWRILAVIPLKFLHLLR